MSTEFEIVNNPQYMTGIKDPKIQMHGGNGLVIGHEGKSPNVQEGINTRASGCPFSSVRLMTAGQHGPALLQDIEFLEKAQYFDREQIPPRNVHALGTGVHGTFEVTNDVSKWSKAKLFQKVGGKVPVFVRFSGVFTEKGEADLTRDLRGIAVKFYTEEGNWDILAVNTPVFNVRDAKMGPDAVHAFKRDPRTYEWNDTQVWDFVVNHPESLQQTLMIYTDRVGTPLSYRTMHGYACNTYSFINADNKRVWIRLHLVSKQEPIGLTEHEAKLLAGEDPNWLARDLREAIERGDYPEWKLCFQFMNEEDGYKNPIAFDCTKAWPHADFPLYDIGTIRCTANPIDYHAETEQVAFSPANIVPGINFSPDKLLQGRLFMYDDTQFHRLGPNFKQLPINRPLLVEPNTMYIGGHHQHEYKNKWPHYYPSNFGTIKPSPNNMIPPLTCDGPGYIYEMTQEGTDADYYEQATIFIGALPMQERLSLFSNLANSLAFVGDNLFAQVAKHLSKIDQKMADTVTQIRTELRNGTAKKTEGELLWQTMRDLLCKGTPRLAPDSGSQKAREAAQQTSSGKALV